MRRKKKDLCRYDDQSNLNKLMNQISKTEHDVILYLIILFVDDDDESMYLSVTIRTE
jgi:hypothetical protein